MILGTVREIKTHEYRVGLTPESAHELHAHGHTVLVERGAGAGIGADDKQYKQAGWSPRPAMSLPAPRWS
jgi:alanine dehydrogenase